jgi:hypothetical protein
MEFVSVTTTAGIAEVMLQRGKVNALLLEGTRRQRTRLVGA